MHFKKTNSDAYLWVEAVPDSAFVFDKRGNFCGCNQLARDLFGNMGIVDAASLGLVAFKEKLKSYEASNAPFEIMVDNHPYRYDIRGYEGGVLVVLDPLKSGDHILRLSAALDNMPWGILTIDLDCDEPVVVYANKTSGRYIGADSSAIIHQRACHVLGVFGLPGNFIDSVKTDGPGHRDFEKKDNLNNIRWFRIHSIPYRQNRHYCLIVMEDMTEEKYREMHYLQAQRLEALGQMAGGVAHDFNNILSIIDGYARMGKKTSHEIPETFDCLNRITQAVERASAITSQLLTFGSQPVQDNEIIDLGRAVKAQEALLRPIMDASINLNIKSCSELYTHATQDAVCQILLNLCINSRDSMPSGGDLIVETGRKSDRVFLRVIDSGEGMPPEVRAKMFDPFFTTKECGKGTGLGLSMVYAIVKDMNGEIDVITEEGAGTSITVWLPFTAPEKNDVNPIEDDPYIFAMKFTGMTALVVEDDPDLLEILKTTLSDFGLVVFAVPNGTEAMALQNDYKGKIDFLITDVVMPDMNGVKLSVLFKTARPDTKIIFMSGYPSNGDMARVALPPNAILLHKPVKMEGLCSVLQKMSEQENGKGGQSFKSYAVPKNR